MIAAAVAMPPGTGANHVASAATTWYATPTGTANRREKSNIAHPPAANGMTAGGGRTMSAEVGTPGCGWRIRRREPVRRPPGALTAPRAAAARRVGVSLPDERGARGPGANGGGAPALRARGHQVGERRLAGEQAGDHAGERGGEHDQPGGGEGQPGGGEGQPGGGERQPGGGEGQRLGQHRATFRVTACACRHCATGWETMACMAQAHGIPTVTLAGDVVMPLVGFGTWRLRVRQAYEALRFALDVGYRHIDTATMYGNEAEIGRAIRDSGVDRRDIFVTTKLPPSNVGRERQTIAASLRALGTDYVDLWLVHSPPRGKAWPSTWREFLAARDDGLP